MNDIQRVFQRIQTIEQRFGVHPGKVPSGFSNIMAQAEQKVMRTTAANVGSSDITKMIQIAAQKHGVDPKLAIAVAQTESGLATDAVSPAGAVGIMQLMPETARSLGVRNIYDPRENIDGGVRYLKQMLNSFGGDLTKALAAYNAGPAAVKQHNGIPPYPETHDYVAKVMQLYRHGSC